MGFISLDGVDGAGKSTQIALLAASLRADGWTVTPCRDPGGTPVGDQIRNLLLHSRADLAIPAEMFLYMASRAQLVDEVIRPALARGEVVVCDRYLLANVVYQGHAGGLDPRLIWEIGKAATGGAVPDLTLILDLPVPESLARKKEAPDRMEAKGIEFLDRVRQGFLTEANRDPDRIKVIDARAAPETVARLIREEVLRVLGPRPRS